MSFVDKIKKKISQHLVEKAIERQLNKLSSSDCDSSTLCQSYSFLMRLASSHKDNSEILSKIYSALDVCFSNPKNNRETYDAAMTLAGDFLQNDSKFTPYVADMYKRISNKDSVFPYIESFYERHPEKASVVIDCIKNMSDNNVKDRSTSERSVIMLSNICKTAKDSNKIKALDAMCEVVANEDKENKKAANLGVSKIPENDCIYHAMSSINEMDLSSPEVMHKALDVIGFGLANKDQYTFDYATQTLFQMVRKHPEMAKDALNTVKSKFNENKDNYAAESSFNMMSNVLHEIVMADGSLAKDVTNLEKELHPMSPKFRADEIDGNIILKNFVYDPYEPGKLISVSEWKNGELCNSQQIKNGVVLAENKFKDGVKDGI